MITKRYGIDKKNVTYNSYLAAICHYMLYTPNILSPLAEHSLNVALHMVKFIIDKIVIVNIICTQDRTQILKNKHWQLSKEIRMKTKYIIYQAGHVWSEM